MTTEAGAGGQGPRPVDRRAFLKAAGFVAAGGAVAAGIAVRELTRPGPISHLVAHRHDGEIPLDPTDRAWSRLETWSVPLLIQNMVPPFAPDLAVPEVRVRALHNREQIAFLVTWDDQEEDLVDAMSRFRDAVAIQLPVDPAIVPAVTMGAATQPVHIMQWRAAWQVDVDRGRQGVKDAFPNMYHDAPPEALMGEAAARQFYPAMVAGNPMARRDRTSPVEDLTAVGFGSLTTHETQTATGRGAFDGRGWRVILQTPLSAGAEKAALTPGITTVIAFAVWNGSHGNRGSRKQWSNWTDLEIEA
jgi:hypothetical protein